jgi:nucleoside 2-deoxyribosyltransferase
MRIYVAGKLENAARIQQVQEAARKQGHQITYDWTTHGSIGHEGMNRVKEVAENERRGVMAADLVIVILPGGRGTHAELGIAIGISTAVVVWSDDQKMFECTEEGTPCAFYFNRNVTRMLCTFENLLQVSVNDLVYRNPWRYE